ncbi:unannotated protein [freshwater metagenome]|uniref:Unannotated protein n=1 Tax=freshwater metagenome TaxID=449393 RepID=A0A6J7L5F8_9ZZZZ
MPQPSVHLMPNVLVQKHTLHIIGFHLVVDANVEARA